VASASLGPAQNGTRRSIRVGEPVTVRLPELRTAGIRWRPEVDPSAVEVIEEHFEPPGTQPGAAGTREVTFAVLRPGPARIRLVAGRSWQADRPVDEYTVDLDAAPGPGE
jgi:predicted secreted protein